MTGVPEGEHPYSPGEHYRGMANDPTAALRTFADHWAGLGMSQGTIGSREPLLDVFTTVFKVMPVTEYVGEIEAMGEWQARARRIINAANALFDTPVPLGTSVRRTLDQKLIELRDALIATDFRVEEITDGP